MVREECEPVPASRSPQSILSRLTPERIAYEPYPCVWTGEALDPEYYAELAAGFPRLDRIAGPQALASNKAFRLPACRVLADPVVPAVWRDFFAYHTSGAFLQEQIAFWRTAIDREYPDLEARFGKALSQLTSGVRHYRGKLPENLIENLRADAMLDCQFVVNSPVRKPSSVRGSHVDKPFKLFAALLYFRDPEDRSTGGDLLLERFEVGRGIFDRRQQVVSGNTAPVASVRYGPNTLVAWLNTSRSLHSVSPRSVTPAPRRYVNLLTECYRLPTQGFFELERTLGGRLHEAAKRAWRRRLLRPSPRRMESGHSQSDRPFETRRPHA
jgi:hypothetical protein